MESEHPARMPLSKSGFQPASTIDVVEKDGRVYVKVEIPGVSANEISVSLSDDLLRICAEREGRDAGVVDADQGRCSEIVGSSEKLADCLSLLLEASTTDASVLLCGETGTGKELFARAIHKNSARAQGNFVAIDCTVLPEPLVASLLFGHEKGAFTGADKASEGLIRQAHCGTLFLDEVGELSPRLQKTFLRVLQEHSFRPLGSKAEIKSDFRLVAATNRDLQQGVALGQFRQDLLYRLQAYCINLPPLRSRISDIHPLAIYHTNRLCRRHGFPVKQLTPEFIQTLSLYPWPGNVRELINTLEQALFTARYETTLFAKHLPQHIRIQVAKSALQLHRPGQNRQSADAGGKLPSLHDFRNGVCARAERAYLSNLVQHAGQNIPQACRLSGLSRSHFYSLIKKHQISFH